MLLFFFVLSNRINPRLTLSPPSPSSSAVPLAICAVGLQPLQSESANTSPLRALHYACRSVRTLKGLPNFAHLHTALDFPGNVAVAPRAIGSGAYDLCAVRYH